MTTNNLQKDVRNKEAGFTIIESLVAIAILVAIVIGASGAVQSGISSNIYSKDQVTAFYLAQEAIEQIRNRRDSNAITDSHWLAGIAERANDPCYFGKACIVDAVTNAISSCPSGPGSCSVVRYDGETGFFGHDLDWTPTIFRREVSITSINENEVSILVTVDWSKGLSNRQFRAKENILNWQ